MPDFAQIAYEAFHDGKPPMPWRELPQCSRDKWFRAAQVVIAQYQRPAAEVRP